MLGILLANTGSPAAPTARAVRSYLAQFLSDRRVVDLPKALWLPVLHAIILPLRPRRSARLYAHIWTEAGSPLVVNTLRLAAALQARLDVEMPAGCRVVVGMRYGAPSIAAGLRSLYAAGCDAITVLPLFPQYSSTTTASIFDAVFAELHTWTRLPALRLINSYYDHPAYLRAVVESLRMAWQDGSMPQRLLFSFHGIPRSYVERGDPYEIQCYRSAELAARALGLADGTWQVAFQSRFGLNAWLTPTTHAALLDLGGAEIGRVDVIAPGFAADCLETLDEIANEELRAFLEAGGGGLHYVPALNASVAHVQALMEILDLA